jgi:hypothetical protein
MDPLSELLAAFSTEPVTWVFLYLILRTVQGEGVRAKDRGQERDHDGRS